MQKINVKNMVCDRCIMSVENILSEIEINFEQVTLGEITIENNISDEKFNILNEKLQKIGFEIIKDDDNKIIENIRTEIITLIYKKTELLEKVILSDYLSSKLHKDYSSLSKLFSIKTGTTIEKYFILQKIERAKELISYNQLNINEIAYQLGYSSSQHFSNQFKKITKFTPSQYKKEFPNRKTLDRI